MRIKIMLIFLILSLTVTQCGAEYSGIYNNIYTYDMSYGYRSVSREGDTFVMSLGYDGYPFNETIDDMINNETLLIVCKEGDKEWIIDTEEYGTGQIGDLLLINNELIVLIRNETNNWIKSFDVESGETMRNLTLIDEFIAYDVYANAMLETDGVFLYIFEDEDMMLYSFDFLSLEYINQTEILLGGVEDVGSLHDIALDGDNIWVWYESKGTRSSYGRSVDNPAKLLRVDISSGYRNYEVEDIPDFENSGMTDLGWMIEISVTSNEMIMYWSRGYYTIISDIMIGSSVTEPVPLHLYGILPCLILIIIMKYPSVN